MPEPKLKTRKPAFVLDAHYARSDCEGFAQILTEERWQADLKRIQASYHNR